MLMRRATASVLISYASCLGLSPVIMAKIHSKGASQPEIAKNSLKPLILGFKVVQGHRCWYPRKARQPCLLWYAASVVSICDRSLARLTVDQSKPRVLKEVAKF